MSRKTQNEERKYQWQTWWSIVGPKLPQSEIRLHNSAVFAPLTEDTFEHMKANRPPIPSVTPTTDSFVVHYPPRDEIQSRHRLQIDIEASDEDEAGDFAQRIVDRYIMSLSLAVPGGRYHAELRLLRRTDDPQEYTAWSQHVTISVLAEPECLDELDIRRVTKLFNSLEHDSIAENAYIHLFSAWQLQITAGSKPLERSILQHYVLCIEALVNGAMAKVRKDQRDQIRLEERKFASEFAETLSKRADKPYAIRQASTRLREISLSNMLPSIDAIAPIFKLSVEMAGYAKDLYRFRSSSLSHPGRTESEGLQKWLFKGAKVSDICLADRVARAFFLGYCDCFIQTNDV